jgi:hypothetical protein
MAGLGRFFTLEQLLTFSSSGFWGLTHDTETRACLRLSQAYSCKIKPEYLQNVRVHPFSALPARAGKESVAFKEEKLDGSLTGFPLASTARSGNYTLSNWPNR